MSLETDFVCNKGQDFYVKFGVRQKNGEMADLTGCRLQFQVSEKLGSATPMAGFVLDTDDASLVYNSSTGYVTGKVPKAVTSELGDNVKTGVATAIIVWTDNLEERLFESNVRFTPKRELA